MEKTSKKTLVITFANQIFLQLIWLQIQEIWSKFQKIWVSKTLDKQRELFFPNTHNFLVLFTDFESSRILKSAMDKLEVKVNAKLRPN